MRFDYLGYKDYGRDKLLKQEALLTRASISPRQYGPLKKNIAKGTTDPRVEFCLPK